MNGCRCQRALWSKGLGSAHGKRRPSGSMSRQASHSGACTVGCKRRGVHWSASCLTTVRCFTTWRVGACQREASPPAVQDAVRLQLRCPLPGSWMLLQQACAVEVLQTPAADQLKCKGAAEYRLQCDQHYKGQGTHDPLYSGCSEKDGQHSAQDRHLGSSEEQGDDASWQWTAPLQPCMQCKPRLPLSDCWFAAQCSWAASEYS